MRHRLRPLKHRLTADTPYVLSLRPCIARVRRQVVLLGVRLYVRASNGGGPVSHALLLRLLGEHAALWLVALFIISVFCPGAPRLALHSHCIIARACTWAVGSSL